MFEHNPSPNTQKQSKNTHFLPEISIEFLHPYCMQASLRSGFFLNASRSKERVLAINKLSFFEEGRGLSIHLSTVSARDVSTTQHPASHLWNFEMYKETFLARTACTVSSFSPLLSSLVKLLIVDAAKSKSLESEMTFFLLQAWRSKILIASSCLRRTVLEASSKNRN